MSVGDAAAVAIFDAMLEHSADGRRPTGQDIDFLFDKVDDLLLASDYPAVNVILLTATQRVDALHLNQLLGLLTLTIAYKDTLKCSRSCLYAAIEARLRSEGQAHRVKACLDGLE